MRRLETFTQFTFILSLRFCKFALVLIIAQGLTLILLVKSFQLVVWFLPSFTVSAVSVCIIGIFLGPIYPIAMKHVARVLPGHLVNGTIGWISACGATGSALFSLMTGAMASKWGIQILQPLCVFFFISNFPSNSSFSFFFFPRFSCFFFFFRLFAMMVVAGSLWFFVPKKPL